LLADLSQQVSSIGVERVRSLELSPRQAKPPLGLGRLAHLPHRVAEPVVALALRRRVLAETARFIEKRLGFDGAVSSKQEAALLAEAPGALAIGKLGVFQEFVDGSFGRCGRSSS